MTVHNNRFGHHTRTANCAINRSPSPIAFSDNVWQDTGKPVTIRESL